MMGSVLSWERVSMAAAILVLALFLRRHFFRRRPKPGCFSGRRALITGAGSGVGAALARRLNELGAELVLCGRNRERLEQTAAALPQPDLPVSIFELDLNQPEAIDEAVETMAQQLQGRVHILVNNAGQSYRGRIKETEIGVHQQLMRVNYMGHVALTTAWMKHLRQRRKIVTVPRDHVVFVSSVQGRISIPYRSAYSAAKHALQAFADCLRAEEPCLHILVASPGYINTNLSRSALRGSGEVHGELDATTASGMSPESVAEGIVCALEAREPEVTMAPLSNSLAIRLRALWPGLYFAIMSWRAARSKAY